MNARRIICLLLVLCLIVPGAAATAPTQESTSTVSAYIGNPSVTPYLAPMGIDDQVWIDAMDAVRCGLRTRAATIDLSTYHLPKGVLPILVGAIINREPEFYYVDQTFLYLADSAGFAVYIRPTYHGAEVYDPDLYEAALTAAMESALLPGMTDVEKALSLHDYLALNCAYDPNLTETTAYDALVYGQGVCQSYAMAYRALLERAGIRCTVITSETMNHAWNLVELDGSWYHVDVTWDDQNPDLEGRVNHAFFLLSDSAMATTSHEGDSNLHVGWEQLYPCTDTRYDTGCFWTDIRSAILFGSSTYSFLRDGGSTLEVILRDRTTGEETVLFQIDAIWPVVGAADTYYTAAYAGLSYEDGYFYFNTQDTVYRLSEDGGQCVPVCTATPNIYGCFVSHGVLYLTLASDPKGTDWQHHTRTLTHDGIVPFTDIAYGRFYYHNVGWAYRNGLVQGMTDTTFEPDSTCTRAQAVTFLYRAAGSPAVSRTDCPFVDVEPGRFYYKAVLWALENGIVQGIDATHFEPDTTVTRGHFVTFLHRLAGKPTAGSTAAFTDVEPGRFYTRAVSWASELGIVKGMDANCFCPDDPCNRAQVVTFLYRYFG